MDVPDLLCSRCLGYLALRQADAVLSIIEPDDTPTTFKAAVYDLQDLAGAIRKAFECEWTVKINTVRIGPAITTWQGDPICELHLFEQMDEEERSKITTLDQARATAPVPFLIRTWDI